MNKLNQLIVFELSRCLSLKDKIRLSGVCKELHRRIHYKNASGKYICLKTNGVEKILFKNIVYNSQIIPIGILIKAVVDINYQNNGTNTTALIEASHKDGEKIIKLLLEHGANVDIQNDLNETALSVASYRGIFSTVKLLLENGAKINIEDIYGRTAMYYANHFEYTSIISLISEYEQK